MMGEFTSSLGNIYYEFHELKNAPTLVLVGGLTQSTLAWNGVVSMLKEKFQILTLDLIFQGKSSENENFLTFELHAQTINELTEFLQITSYVPVGISYGGAVTMRLLTNPKFSPRIEKSVLISTFAHKPPQFNAIGESWLISLQAGGYDLFSEVLTPWVLGKSYFENPLIPIENLKKFRQMFPMSTSRLLKLMQATAESGDYRNELKKVVCPVLIIFGEEDLLTTPEVGREIAKSIQNQQFVVLKGKGHTLNLEAVPEISERIEKFALKT